MRSLRFSGRKQSHFKVKQRALKAIARRKTNEELYKLGKMDSADSKRKAGRR
ncbi:MAG: hypothetical protein KGI49_01060 [Patescibacteria group bacterium]|nr:hypothetical protein [Patescibacteria group bacterium]